MKAFLEAFHRVWDEDVGDWIMTDDPSYRSKTVFSQFAKKYELETECFERKVTKCRLHPSVLWEQLASTYHVAMLSPAAKERLRYLTLDAWRNMMDGGGQVSAEFVVNRLLCRKKKTPG